MPDEDPVVEPMYVARRAPTQDEVHDAEGRALPLLYVDPQQRALELQQAAADRAAAEADAAMARARAARQAVTGSTGAELTGNEETDALAARIALGIKAKGTGRSAAASSSALDAPIGGRAPEGGGAGTVEKRSDEGA